MIAVSAIDPVQLEQLRKDEPVTLLDVRTEAEVARGLIEGAKHIPLNMLPGRLAELDPQGVLVVYCQSGARSAQACAWLAEQGFARLHNLHGGLAAWARAGLPITTPR
jgi:rhodanese-related sulfurtransferase